METNESSSSGRREREADHRPATSVEVKKPLIFTSTPLMNLLNVVFVELSVGTTLPCSRKCGRDFNHAPGATFVLIY
jgi:hypothetical protein